MKKDYVIKILFIEDSLEKAEQIISQLRNAGIAIRPARATSTVEVEHALAEMRPDLVLFDPHIREIDVREVAQLLNTSGHDHSLLGLLENLDTQSVVDLFAGGVRGIAVSTQPKQLITVVQHEYEALQTRRQVRRLKISLRESERRCDALLDSSTDAIAYVHEGMHVRANQSYLDAFGYVSFDELLGIPVLDMVEPSRADEFKALLRGHARHEKMPAQTTLFARRADDSRFESSVELAPATFEGEACLQIVFRRESVIPAALQQLQRDPVTHLLNRPRMLECIDDAVASAAAGKKNQALLLIEPDNWTSLVASIGLGKTDKLLGEFADRVRMLLDSHDVAGMIAEHTLCIVLDSRPDDAVRQWIERLQQSVSQEIFDLGKRSISVTAGIGGSLLGEKNAQAEQLLNQASEALRTAQSLGSGRLELYDPAALDKADEERDQYWFELLENAVTNDTFMLHHQQIVSLQDVEGDYSEILLRMTGPQGEVMPGFFMPIAEKFGFNNKIDRWVLGKSINALKARDGQNNHTTFFVKLHADSLRDENLLPWLKERLNNANLKRGRLVLEMTESKVMTMLRPAHEFVKGWKQLGGQFALEQFGSGLDSFQLLNHIDADYLKIDRSFMADLPQHPENQKKVAEICHQAQALKRQTIAEWVEDATSTSLLFAAGVDFVQGNFLQYPQRLA